MKRIAILQSNYIPWRGYFDMIAHVDEFILYDQVQYTKNDWRNRNKIKTPTGEKWITIPTGSNIKRLICEVELLDQNWQTNHWSMLEANYKKAKYYDEISEILAPIYLHNKYINLSHINADLIKVICKYLSITTRITNSRDYLLIGDRVDKLVNLCLQTQSDTYVTGLNAKNYLTTKNFLRESIMVEWFQYKYEKHYPQHWGKDFINNLSILDLLFNCGKSSRDYMMY